MEWSSWNWNSWYTIKWLIAPWQQKGHSYQLGPICTRLHLAIESASPRDRVSHSVKQLCLCPQIIQAVLVTRMPRVINFARVLQNPWKQLENDCVVGYIMVQSDAYSIMVLGVE